MVASHIEKSGTTASSAVVNAPSSAPFSLASSLIGNAAVTDTKSSDSESLKAYKETIEHIANDVGTHSLINQKLREIFKDSIHEEKIVDLFARTKGVYAALDHFGNEVPILATFLPRKTSSDQEAVAAVQAVFGHYSHVMPRCMTVLTDLLTNTHFTGRLAITRNSDLLKEDYKPVKKGSFDNLSKGKILASELTDALFVFFICYGDLKPHDQCASINDKIPSNGLLIKLLEQVLQKTNKAYLFLGHHRSVRLEKTEAESEAKNLFNAWCTVNKVASDNVHLNIAFSEKSVQGKERCVEVITDKTIQTKFPEQFQFAVESLNKALLDKANLKKFKDALTEDTIDLLVQQYRKEHSNKSVKVLKNEKAPLATIDEPYEEPQTPPSPVNHQSSSTSSNAGSNKSSPGLRPQKPLKPSSRPASADSGKSGALTAHRQEEDSGKSSAQISPREGADAKSISVMIPSPNAPQSSPSIGASSQSSSVLSMPGSPITPLLVDGEPNTLTSPPTTANSVDVKPAPATTALPSTASSSRPVSPETRLAATDVKSAPATSALPSTASSSRPASPESRLATNANDVKSESAKSAVAGGPRSQPVSPTRKAASGSTNSSASMARSLSAAAAAKSSGKRTPSPPKSDAPIDISGVINSTQDMATVVATATSAADQLGTDVDARLLKTTFFAFKLFGGGKVPASSLASAVVAASNSEETKALPESQLVSDQSP